MADEEIIDKLLFALVEKSDGIIYVSDFVNKVLKMNLFNKDIDEIYQRVVSEELALALDVKIKDGLRCSPKTREICKSGGYKAWKTAINKDIEFERRLKQTQHDVNISTRKYNEATRWISYAALCVSIVAIIVSIILHICF